jgi:hypothetical protein
MSATGFPNMFMLLGPNTGLGHNSVLLMIEAQVAYLRKLLAYRRIRGIATIEPGPRPRRSTSPSSTRAPRGASGPPAAVSAGDRRNSELWPGSVRAYQRRLARFQPGDYLTEHPRSEPARREARPVAELV